jgi:hypothetical protein
LFARVFLIYLLIILFFHFCYLCLCFCFDLETINSILSETSPGEVSGKMNSSNTAGASSSGTTAPSGETTVPSSGTTTSSSGTIESSIGRASDGAIMAASIAAGMKAAQKAPTLAGKAGVMLASVALGGSAIVTKNVSGNLSENAGQKSLVSSRYTDLSGDPNSF